MLDRNRQLVQAFTEDLPAHDPKLVGLRHAWQARGAIDRLPSRADFTADHLKPWQNHVAIVSKENSQPARFRIHVMGLACVYLAGSDLTGKWIDECVAPADRARTLQPYLQCVEYGVPVFSNAIYVKQGISRTIVHRLYLPCADNGRDVDSLIVGAYSLEQPGRFFGAYPPVAITLTEI